VRVTAPPGVAFEFVAPFAAALKRRVPEVTLHVLSSIEYLDLARGEADLAIRFKKPTQRDLTVIASFEDDVGLFCAPSYARSLPHKPALADLAFIAWAPPYDRLSPNPELARLGVVPAFCADDFLVQMRACEAGLGIMILGQTRPRSSRWKLVQLPSPFPLPKTALHLVCAKRALDIPRVRVVADALVAELSSAQTGGGD
jgi:DNA-binding transcriptional LysR family regulator